METFIKIILTVTIVIISFTIGLSQTLKGTVYELNVDGKKIGISDANVYWAHSLKGTTTDETGNFSIEIEHEHHNLVISFIGYKSDTMYIADDVEYAEIILQVNRLLQEVVITNKRESSFISRIDPAHTHNITGEEFKKAACCNLSESFETNASVDVSYSDAVSGAKQIQLLGLAGIYSQIMTENIPNIRGMATIFGLTYIPGSWMESIQISKGAATVVNGYESTTGQINVEYKKPDKSEKIYLNVLGSDAGKTEMNMNTSVLLSKKWSSMVFFHVENNNIKIDQNNDSFLDMPLVRQYNFLNRWKYRSKNFASQFGIKLLDEERIGGQTNFSKNQIRNTFNPYGINIKTRRYEAFAKGGYIFPKRPYASLAYITTASIHDIDSYFGMNDYKGIQKNLFANLIYQSILSNTSHKIKTGLSFVLDDYNESFNDSIFTKQEITPGVFGQYTYILPKKFTLMAGLRIDEHNLYGLFITPRTHVKYNLNKNNILRASAGKGYRSPQLFAENSYLLVSSREMRFDEEVKHEEAWNYGISFVKYIDIIGKKLTFSTDFYRTDFINQVVIDMEQDASRITIYNLDGKSYANNIQAEVSYELLRGLDLIMAYRFTDVKVTLNKELMDKPLVNKYKGLVNLSYKTVNEKWQLDFTSQFNGMARLPNTQQNPAEHQREDKSPSYTMIHGQITRYFKVWNIYLGVENLTDFRQSNPIVAANDPFGQYFDASMTWGPVSGRKLYLGLRYMINRK